MSTSFKNKILTGLVILLLVANITMITIFCIGMRKMHPAPPLQQTPEFVIKELSLNDKQQQQYNAMVKQHRDQTKLIREQLRSAKDSFFNLLANENINDSIKNNSLTKIASFERQLDDLTFDHFKEVRKICNPEQQQKFDKIIKDVLRMMSGPPQQGNRPPGPKADRLPPPPGDGPPQGPPPGN